MLLGILSQLILKMGVIHLDLDIQGHFSHFDFDSEFGEFWLVFTITWNGFEQESQNLDQICILGFFQLVLKMGDINLDLHGHLTIYTQNSEKQRSTSLLYTDLGWPKGVTRPKHALVIPRLQLCMLTAGMVLNCCAYWIFITRESLLPLIFLLLFGERIPAVGVLCHLIWLFRMNLNLIRGMKTLYKIYWTYITLR